LKRLLLLVLATATCGGRTPVGLLIHSGGDAGSAEASVDASSGEALDGGLDGASGASPPCLRLPATGTALTSFEGLTSGLGTAGGLGVYEETLFVGATVLMARVPWGVIGSVGAAGGQLQALSAPGYVFGKFVFDSSSIYYPRTLITPVPSGIQVTQAALNRVDLMSGARQDLPGVGQMFDVAATATSPGVFWLAGSEDAGAPAATVLYHWGPDASQPLSLAMGHDMVGLGVDSASVYWADNLAGVVSIFALPREGGVATILATASSPVDGWLVGVTSTSVLFAANSRTEGALMAVPKSGGSPTLLVHTAKIAGAWVDTYSGDVFWTSDDRSLHRTSGTGITDMVPWTPPTLANIQFVSFDACNVYVAVDNDTNVFGFGK
jgi:hypothetical protein